MTERTCERDFALVPRTHRVAEDAYEYRDAEYAYEVRARNAGYTRCGPALRVNQQSARSSAGIHAEGCPHPPFADGGYAVFASGLRSRQLSAQSLSRRVQSPLDRANRSVKCRWTSRVVTDRAGKTHPTSRGPVLPTGPVRYGPRPTRSRSSTYDSGVRRSMHCASSDSCSIVRAVGFREMRLMAMRRAMDRNQPGKHSGDRNWSSFVIAFRNTSCVNSIASPWLPSVRKAMANTRA